MKMEAKIKTWIISARPHTLPASIAPVLAGLACAYSLNGSIAPLTAMLTIGCALFMQIAANQINDYFDFAKGIDNQNRLGPVRVCSSGKISPAKLGTIYKISLGIAAILGVLLVIKGGLPIIIIGIISLLASYLYSAGPLPLSTCALGEIAALIFFGPVAVWGTFFLQAKSLGLSLNPSDSLPVIIVGIGTGAVASIIMSINNLRDRISDRQQGKTTLANLLSERRARIIPIFFLIISLIAPVLLAILSSNVKLTFALAAPLPFFANWKAILRNPIDRRMNQILAESGRYMLLYVILLATGLLL